MGKKFFSKFDICDIPSKESDKVNKQSGPSHYELLLQIVSRITIEARGYQPCPQYHAHKLSDIFNAINLMNVNGGKA